MQCLIGKLINLITVEPLNHKYLGKWTCGACVKRDSLRHYCSATRPMLPERRCQSLEPAHDGRVFKQSIRWCLKYFSHKSNVSYKYSFYRHCRSVMSPIKNKVPTHFHQTALFSKEPIYLGDSFIASARPVRNFHLL